MMPTKLYAQWPKRPEIDGNHGLVYFRFPLSKQFFDNYQQTEFRSGMAFCVYAILELPCTGKKTGQEKCIPLAEPMTRENIPSTEHGSQPSLHPDQQFFIANQSIIENNIQKIQQAIREKKYKSILRIEIHSSLVPCVREHGCRDFLQKKIMSYLDPKNLKFIERRDIWLITYRFESHDYDSKIGQYSKPRQEGALTANATRLDNIGAAVTHNPETGSIRCIASISGSEFPCINSRLIVDDTKQDSDYHKMMSYQKVVLMAITQKRQAPKLPALLIQWQLERKKCDSKTHPKEIQAIRDRLQRYN